MRLVFWQQRHSPHQFALLEALSRHPGVKGVELVISQSMTQERLKMGWVAPTYGQVSVYESPSEAEIELMVGRETVDTVHIFSGLAVDTVSEQGLAACIRQRAPIALMAEAGDWTGHGLAKYPRLAKHMLLRRKYGTHIKALFPMGQLGADWYRRVGYKTSIMTPLGYFVEPQRVITEPDNQFEILFVGRALDYKGGALLLAALDKIKHLDWHASFVTEGVRREAWEELSRKLGVGAKVTFNDFESGDKVARRMAQASVFVLPNQGDEGWGAVVNEALMQGTPVICTTLTGAKDMVADDRGQVVEPSAEALAAALERQIAAGIPDRARRDTIAAYTVAHWSGEAGAERMVTALSRLLGSGQ